ncbi:hypothetical protein [Phycisphaera mikurensis]|uniref:Lipoprotein n=1 Tax=Phycisphaera mikurensis (strain NBRC 102666 / KCTC 22515 / FYK2301M01) TaxID=1142394 RepID=I0ID44_PHYMF|nr:hypothetical protein [Phycisphaera mikurensis]MBB6442306.1 1-acyl-sn-glycerol-3-phosphate acyltransferase [Phycisphaera mikurensis]BAM03182.1 hypothetical protein PSMK_10230 [Phycisphaera mikurensis NBRC 102666]
MPSRLPAALLLVLPLLLPACVAPTYVNIPSEGGIAASDPNSFNVRDVVADSIAAAVEREPLEGVYEILLPEGTTQQTYQAVVRQIGGGAIAPDTLRDRPVPSVRVVAVRIRNQDAEVDVVRPSPTGRSVVRVFLKWYYGGDWAVQRVKPLRIPAEELLLRTATPPPPPDAEDSGE